MGMSPRLDGQSSVVVVEVTIGVDRAHGRPIQVGGDALVVEERAEHVGSGLGL